MLRASLCPSSGEQDRVLLLMVYCTGCAGCGCVRSCVVKLCALCEGRQSNSKLHTVHTAYDAAPVDSRNSKLHTVHTAYDAAPVDSRNSKLHTVHTAYDAAPHNHSQHNQCSTPYAIIHGLVLLMMGIMMPETCWNRSLIINIGLVASCWFISLHPTFHDARSQEPKTSKITC